MSLVLALAIALGAALPTTLVVLGLWVAKARLVDGDSVDSVFLAFVFLYVPLIFFVSIAANIGAVAVGQAAALVAPDMARQATVAAAGVLVLCGCAWTQRGTLRHSAPVSPAPVALFAIADMLILAGGLMLTPRDTLF